MGSSTSPISLKILLISTGVLSAATAMKLSFPLLLNFAVYDIPVIWSVILSWLRPPYLYVVINGIIITIVASSRFQYHYNHYHNDDHSPTLRNETSSLPIEDLTTESPPIPIQPSLIDALQHPAVPYVIENTESEEETLVVYEIETPVIDVETVAVNDSGLGNVESEDKFVVTRSTRNSSQLLLNSHTEEFVQPVFTLPVKEKEKPLVSSRFAQQRRLAKINPEGVKSLRVTKPRKHETLESTWRTITDGRHIPLNRHLRKTDTAENLNHHNHAPPLDAYSGEEGPASDVVDDYTPVPINDRTGHQSRPTLSSKNSLPSGGKLRKEGSLSHDELNRRVEAFIKKFNDEMRLQRQESMKRYMDMINRGVE